VRTRRKGEGLIAGGGACVDAREIDAVALRAREIGDGVHACGDGVVDEAVGARAADEPVGACAACEGVVGGAADQGVVEG
jgi:hypothetical protein